MARGGFLSGVARQWLSVARSGSTAVFEQRNVFFCYHDGRVGPVQGHADTKNFQNRDASREAIVMHVSKHDGRVLCRHDM